MDKLTIVKLGGNIINDEKLLHRFLQKFSQISTKKILIHGGGVLVDDLANKLHIPQQKINGRRITNKDSLQLATMVYAGFTNKTIVAQLQFLQNNAIGLSGADANIICASKRNVAEIDYGYVGDINEQNINTNQLTTFLQMNLVPVVCSITHNGKGQLLNTNADTITSIVAIAMSKKYKVQLIYCFDKKGVLHNVNDPTSIIKMINETNFETLKQQKIVTDGMLPKLENAIQSIKNGVQEIILTNGANVLNAHKQELNAGTYITA